jgi:hypothetical protein
MGSSASTEIDEAVHKFEEEQEQKEHFSKKFKQPDPKTDEENNDDPLHQSLPKNQSPEPNSSRTPETNKRDFSGLDTPAATKNIFLTDKEDDIFSESSEEGKSVDPDYVPGSENRPANKKRKLKGAAATPEPKKSQFVSLFDHVDDLSRSSLKQKKSPHYNKDLPPELFQTDPQPNQFQDAPNPISNPHPRSRSSSPRTHKDNEQFQASNRKPPRTKKRIWTDLEFKALYEGMKNHGNDWAKIKEDPRYREILYYRTVVDLKDKARNEKKARIRDCGYNSPTISVFDFVTGEGGDGAKHYSPKKV